MSLNSPIILEAVYLLSDNKEKVDIEKKIRRVIARTKIFQLREIFPFLNPYEELTELQSEIEKIKEKCNNSPSNENCHACITESRGICWIRIFATILNVSPRAHSPFEIADIVTYTLEQGTYFIIKSENIGGLKGTGDTLYRQCTKLFSNKFSLVFYVNPKRTHPMVIEHIRRIEAQMITNPKFIILDKKYLRQIYRYYLDNFGVKKPL